MVLCDCTQHTANVEYGKPRTEMIILVDQTNSVSFLVVKVGLCRNLKLCTETYV